MITDRSIIDEKNIMKLNTCIVAFYGTAVKVVILYINT
jgi:hypothetical protein